MCVSATGPPIGIYVAIGGVICVVLVIACVVCRVSLRKKPAQSTNDPQGSAAQAHVHAVQRTNTPEAAAIDIPNEHSIVTVPTAMATGIRTMETVDAEMTLPPAMIGEMEAVPVAVAQPV